MVSPLIRMSTGSALALGDVQKLAAADDGVGRFLGHAMQFSGGNRFVQFRQMLVWNGARAVGLRSGVVKGITRRRLASIGAAPLALGAWPVRAQRAELPGECRIFIGFAAGSGIDLMGRAIATRLGMRSSLRISVDNRAGRWGAIPGELLKTNPVGSTLAFLSSTTLADSLLVKDFPFDPQKDIAPLIVAANFPVALAVSPRIVTAQSHDALRGARGRDGGRGGCPTSRGNCANRCPQFRASDRGGAGAGCGSI